MTTQWSQLCNSDREVALAYYACEYVRQNGSSAFGPVRGFGGELGFGGRKELDQRSRSVGAVGGAWRRRLACGSNGGLCATVEDCDDGDEGRGRERSETRPVGCESVKEDKRGCVDDAAAVGSQRVVCGDEQRDSAREGHVDSLLKGKHSERNKVKREKRKKAKKLAGNWRLPKVDGSGGCVSDGSTVVTVDTRTAVEIEAAQTLAERRVAENRLAVAQANAKTASFADRAKTEAWERLSGARMSQRINQANAAAHKAYNAQDKSLQSIDSAGSAGEFALRQMVKEARNSQFVSAYVQKQNELLVRHADPHVLEAIKRIPKPKLDNMFDVLEEQYERMGPEQRAQLDVDANVANAKWDEKLYMGEGVLDDPLPSDGKPSAALQEMMRKVRLQGEMIASGYESQRVAAEKIKV